MGQGYQASRRTEHVLKSPNKIQIKEKCMKKIMAWMVLALLLNSGQIQAENLEVGVEEIGSIHGKFGGKITIYSRGLINAATRTTEYRILAEHKQNSESKSEQVALIYYDEIDSLIEGIDYMSKINQSAFYHAKDTLGIRTHIFNSEDKSFVDFHIGNVKAIYKLSALSEIKALLIKAKNKIDAVKYR